MEFKGQEGLKMLLEKGLDFGLWDQKFADSRCVRLSVTGCAGCAVEMGPEDAAAQRCAQWQQVTNAAHQGAASVACRAAAPTL